MAPPSHVVEDQNAIFDALADPRTHGTDRPVTRIDTHGAAVFLAGDDAYKVKRAVRFPFMDFSTLALRKAACEAEIAVNRTNAPEIYLGILPITCDGKTVRLGGDGEPVEWCVHMRRFDEGRTLDRVAGDDGLPDDVLVRTAAAIAASHARAPVRRGVGFATGFAGLLTENGGSLGEAPDLFPADRVADLTRRSLSLLDGVTPELERRECAGRVRRCHGDLHLRNIVLLDGMPTLFDAIEFDEALATTDVLYDLAFLLMDLGERGWRPAANRVLNRYLVETGDPAELPGLAAMALFVSTRAAIRAKVTAAALPHATGDAAAALRAEATRYFDFAEAVLVPAAPRLFAVGGLSGTGKSTLAARIAPDLAPFPGAVHLRSDVIRKRLMGVAELEPLLESGYTQDVTARVYRALLDEAAAALQAGQSVVVDAVHQRPHERTDLADLARRLDVAFTGLWLEAPVPILVSRADARSGDASDATGAVVEAQAVRDIGPLDWHRIPAGGRVEATLAAARAALAT